MIYKERKRSLKKKYYPPDAEVATKNTLRRKDREWYVKNLGKEFMRGKEVHHQWDSPDHYTRVLSKVEHKCVRSTLWRVSVERAKQGKNIIWSPFRWNPPTCEVFTRKGEFLESRLREDYREVGE